MRMARNWLRITGTSPIEDRLGAFVLVVEGSIPKREGHEEGYWAALRGGQEDRPTDHDLRGGSTEPRAPRRGGRGGDRHLRDLRRDPRDGRQPDRRDGRCPTISAGTGSRRPGCRSCACRAARSSPTTSRETLLYLPLPGWPASPPMIPLDRLLAPDLAVRAARCTTAATGRATTNRADFANEYGIAQVPGQARLLGTGGQRATCPSAGWMAGTWRLPQRRRDLHRLHDAGIPRQVHAVHGRSRPARHACPRSASGSTGRTMRAAALVLDAWTRSHEPKWRHARPELTTGDDPPTPVRPTSVKGAER